MLPAADMVCRDAHPTPNALAVSADSRLLAFVGPSKYVVTVMNAASLEEVSQLEPSVWPCWHGQHSMDVPHRLPHGRPGFHQGGGGQGGQGLSSALCGVRGS